MELEQGIYRHYKGHKYEIMMTARHSETDEWVVVYKALYGDEGIWVRPYEMFMEEVEVNGVMVPRFEKIEEVC
jgi:hypothetical protein